MITLADYWMGRDRSNALDLTPEIEKNAALTIKLANVLLARFGEGRHVNSGWRPPSINAATPGAARKSLHMTGQAIDLEDGDGLLDDWCMSDFGLAQLADIGLWLEHPSSTKGWCHLQVVPPRSGKRVFYP